MFARWLLRVDQQLHVSQRLLGRSVHALRGLESPAAANCCSRGELPGFSQHFLRPLVTYAGKIMLPKCQYTATHPWRAARAHALCHMRADGSPISTAVEQQLQKICVRHEELVRQLSGGSHSAMATGELAQLSKELSSLEPVVAAQNILQAKQNEVSLRVESAGLQIAGSALFAAPCAEDVSVAMLAAE